MNLISENNLTDKQTEYESNYSNYYYSLLAKVTFILYLFFAFFGTDLPFREGGIRETITQTSNIVNQIVYSTLFLTSLIALIPIRTKLFSLVKREKFLTVFLLWCFLTILWSNYSFISFKRFFQYYTTVQIFVTYLSYTKTSREPLTIFQYILGAYVILSMISVLIIPGAKESGGDWRGLAITKNNLGQLAFISILVWVQSLRKSSILIKPVYIALLLISFILLVGSYSSTPLITLFVLIFIGIIFNINKVFEPLGIRKILVYTLFVLLIIMGWLIFTQEKYLVAQFLANIGKQGKDLTFTGRTYLWAYIVNIAQSHLWLGCGFQGFWVGIDPKLGLLYDVIGWVPNQAHNGYIDLLNETGLVGVLLFIILVINYYLNLGKLKKPFFWHWYFIGALIINFTESTFLRPHHSIVVMFMFSYLILFFELKNNAVSDSDH